MISKERLRQGTLLLTAVAVVAMSWLAPLDTPAMERVDAGMKRALVSFATARALTGVIAAVQGTAISATPLGVGVQLTPGQLLAPAHDLLKHFSDWMLAAGVAFGIQKLLITIGSYWLISLLLTVATLAWFWSQSVSRLHLPWLSRAVIVLLLLRFAVPLVTLGTDLVAKKFLDDEYAASQKALDLSSNEAAAVSASIAVAQDSSWIDKAKELAATAGNIKAQFTKLLSSAERATEHVVKLIVIFILQTLIIPLLLLWCLYGMASKLFSARRPSVMPSQPAHVRD